MSPLNIELLVLETRKYRETHLLLVCLSEKLGKIVVTAPYARRHNSPLQAFSQPLTAGTAALRRPAEGSRYYSLRQARVTDAFPRIKNDAYKLACAGVLSGTTGLLAAENRPEAALFSILSGCLKALSVLEREEEVTRLYAAVLIRLLQAGGFPPIPQSCSFCMGDLDGTWLKDERGRVFCSGCLKNGRAVNPEVIRQWETLLQDLSAGNWEALLPETVLAVEGHAAGLLGAEPAGRTYLSLIRGY